MTVTPPPRLDYLKMNKVIDGAMNWASINVRRHHWPPTDILKAEAHRAFPDGVELQEFVTWLTGQCQIK